MDVKSGIPSRARRMLSTTTGRWAVLLGVYVGYLVAYAPLHSVIGNAAGIFITAPVMGARLVLGVKGGLTAGLASLPINLMLVVTTNADWREWLAGGGSTVGSATEVVVGAVTGLLRDLRLQAEVELAHRRRAEADARLLAGRLERSNCELQDVASVAAHDLQEPLRKIRTFAGRLGRNADKELGPERREDLQRIEGAVERMQALINDVLTFSRVTAGGKPFVPVDLGEVAREVVSDLEMGLDGQGGRIEVGQLPVVEADRAQMHRLLQNLIGNGLKFHRADAPPVVSVRAELRNGRDNGQGDYGATELCRITAEDNGIGFDEKYLARIFNIFQRLHPRQSYDGTGIGLAVCRRIAEHHGGSITATSEPGKGAKFMVTLPVKHHEGVGGS